HSACAIKSKAAATYMRVGARTHQPSPQRVNRSEKNNTEAGMEAMAKRRQPGLVLRSSSRKKNRAGGGTSTAAMCCSVGMGPPKRVAKAATCHRNRAPVKAEK